MKKQYVVTGWHAAASGSPDYFIDEMEIEACAAWVMCNLPEMNHLTEFELGKAAYKNRMAYGWHVCHQQDELQKYRKSFYVQ